MSAEVRGSGIVCGTAPRHEDDGHGKGVVVIVINTLEGLTLGAHPSIVEYWGSDILSDLYFMPKRLTGEVRETALASPRFRQRVERLGDLLARIDISSACREALAEFERDTGHATGDEKLYLIVGCDTTTIYTIELAGERVSVLCLESIDGDMDVLRMYLAHEYTHIVRQRLLQRDIFESCLGERLVTEGIAERYSKETVPGRRDAEYCIVDDATVCWVQRHRVQLDGLMAGHLSDTSLMEALFYMFAAIDFPVRCGYVCGLYSVEDHLEHHGLTAKDILVADWRDILESGEDA